MKQFFKMMFASTLGVLLGIGIIILVGTFAIIGIVASVNSQPAYTPASNTVFKLSLNGSLSDNIEENPLDAFFGSSAASQLSLKDVLTSIRVAKNNSNIKGIYIEAGTFSAGTSSIDAIRRALLDFKESGKFIIAYSDTYMQGAYYLCSVADKVFLNPEGLMDLFGLASQTIFYKGIYNKVGIEWEIFKVGTYKGAVEPYMLDKLSDENREQITSYMNGLWGNICKGIADARGISVEKINEYADKALGLSQAENAVAYKLVDELKYKSDVEEYVKEQAGQTGDKFRTAGVDKLKNVEEQINKKAGQIAVLYAEGVIMDMEASPYSNSNYITYKVATELNKLRKNDDIKAVVLRVNSPGGSAFLSDQIWNEVVKLKAEKPVVVSMGDVAASGGYYISCAADKIIAEKNTLTGSIGIFGRFPNATGLLQKLDVTTDIVKTNNYGDFGDFSRPMRDDERAIMQSYIEQGYDTFISRCAEGRSMTKDAIDKIGQGRVWTGEQALERGLVDELGGLDRAVEVAAGLADVDVYRVVGVSGSKNFFNDFMEKQLSDIKTSIAKDMLGKDYEFVKKLNEMRSDSGVLALCPYDIEPL